MQTSVSRGSFTAEILTGGVPRKIYTRSDGRYFVEGVPGAAYTVRVTPRATRQEFILSVDGRHVLDDEPADRVRCHGLVTAAQYEFKGWRVSDSETRKFVFTYPEASVAAQAGDSSNTGVIGLAAYREYVDFVPVAAAATYDSVTYESSVASKGLMKSAPRSDLGTGMGEAQHDPVGRTEFRRAGEAACIEIGYATMGALRAMGIWDDPTPWPGSGQTGYAGYPR